MKILMAFEIVLAILLSIYAIYDLIYNQTLNWLGILIVIVIIFKIYKEIQGGKKNEEK